MASRKRSAERFYLPPLSLVRAVWKRKTSLCLLFIAGCAVTAAVTYEWPPKYKSEAVILVESQRIPQDFVTATVNDDLKERLSSLSAQILAYSRLLEIVKKFDLYHKERQTHAEEEIIEQMRGDIDIQLVKGWSQERPGAFRISYEGKNPALVASVANELGNLFIEENLRSREVQATGTSEFLDNQLADAKRRLEEQEARLSQYKLEHQGELPEQENSLIASLNRLQVQLQGIQEALSRAQQNKILVQDSIQAGQATLATMARIGQRSVAVGTNSSGLGSDPRSIKQLEAQLAELRTRYTEDYPEVLSVKASLAEAKKRADESQARGLDGKGARGKATAQPASPAAGLEEAEIDDPSLAAALANERERLNNLKAQQAVTLKQIESLTSERERILAQINSIQSHVDRLPVREQQMASVTRDYEITKANYRSLLDKKLAAGMAADMEKRQKSERFTMLEPARVPEVPFKPNRPLVGAIGVALSLVLAIAFVIGKTFQENVVLGEWELPKDVVILGRVPLMDVKTSAAESGANPFKRSTAARLAVSFLIAIVVLGIGTGLYFGWRPL
ncbi:MAG TPA: Wzz/FepE/Etk N-terminal domain-containing protein [Bryobacteraceae bacterium]|nr:Wzz/FepE/Etk N-terminal domain-containing protein [Bryobacteraceae bacterium]